MINYNQEFLVTLIQHNDIFNAYLDLDFKIGKWHKRMVYFKIHPTIILYEETK